MECLGVGACTSRHLLYQEGTQFVRLLSFGDGGKFVIIGTQDLAILNDDMLTIVLLDHFVLVVEVELEFLFKGATHLTSMMP